MGNWCLMKLLRVEKLLAYSNTLARMAADSAKLLFVAMSRSRTHIARVIRRFIERRHRDRTNNINYVRKDTNLCQSQSHFVPSAYIRTLIAADVFVCRNCATRILRRPFPARVLSSLSHRARPKSTRIPKSRLRVEQICYRRMEC